MMNNAFSLTLSKGEEVDCQRKLKRPPFWGGLGGVFVFLFFFSSCSNHSSPLKPYGETLETIMLTDTAIVRGVKIGDSFEKIKEIEKVKAKEEGVDEGVNFLHYETQLEGEKNYYTVAYYGGDNKVNHIELDVYFESEEKAALLFKSFQGYFEKKYGQPEQNGEYLLWTDVSNIKTRIVLSDESATYKKGKLTLVFEDINL